MFPFMAPAIIKSAVAILKPQDVFATSLYTSPYPATVNSGLDITTKGGLIWEKLRSDAAGHRLTDTLRGVPKSLETSATATEGSEGVTAISSTGFTTQAWGGGTRVAWSFARAAKFFDIVTWTGDGTSNRQIPHGLGAVPGLIAMKQRSGTSEWPVLHRSTGKDQVLFLSQTAAAAAANTWRNTDPTATDFTTGGAYNASGATYVAYLFAHDPSADGIVQCGSYTGANQTITLGWRPQYLMLKYATSTSDWVVVDSARGSSGSIPSLRPNNSNAESSFSQGADLFTSSGFQDLGFLGSAGVTTIYLAIRAPY